MNIYKLNKTLHRDIGYLCIGMVLIYAISGVAINHRTDWNPNYIIRNQQYELGRSIDKSQVDMALINSILEKTGSLGEYKNHYYPDEERLRIFINGGNITLYLDTGQFRIETLQQRPFFYEINYLHYNPSRIWTWFSDIFCVALTFLAISGLFILKGKNGLIWRGTIFAAIGIILPLLLLLMYL